MTASLRRGVIVGLATVACALLVLSVIIALRSLDFIDRPGFIEVIFALSVVLGALGLWHVHGVVDRHRKALDRLRGAIVTLAGHHDAVLPPLAEAERANEVGQLHDSLSQLLASYAERRGRPSRRLQAILAAMAEAMVVITEQGQVSLVNHAAKDLLGAEEVRVGTSVFAALQRAPIVAAIEQAGEAGRPVAARLQTVTGTELNAMVAGLGEHGGAVLSFAADEVEHRAEVEHDLDLHDQPPPAPEIHDGLALDALPALVLDTETTGLDVNGDRVVSIGAVRMHGLRVYRSRAFDRLVNPTVAIPPRATAVHGITDAMVLDAEGFPAVFNQLRPLLDGTVLVGHHITFDILMLRRECQLYRVAWPDPPFLDTLLLAAGLDVDWPGLGLEDLAAVLGVDVHGRHTALGDSLVTAEVYARLLPRLADAGVTTLGEAVNFCQRPRHIIREQNKAGWSSSQS
jgi:DNA polymerase-3 subunit epsilon